MNRTTSQFQNIASAVVVALLTAALTSCGGGVGSGGTGQEVVTSTGPTVGTVNGFGSVIVDGLSYDNRTAPVVAETAPGRDIAAEVKMGHRVSVDVAASAPTVATQVRVDATVVGSVTDINTTDAANQITVLGQTISLNAVGTAGPITQFGGGYLKAADLRVGDAVEVHAVQLRLASSNPFQATRIDKLSTAPRPLRVTGVVTATSANSVNIGVLSLDTTTAVVLPAGNAVTVGQSISVWAVPHPLALPAPGTIVLQAAQIRIRGLSAAGADSTVSGAASRLDATVKTFNLGSLLVNYANAAITPAGATVANSRYVQVRGTTAADGTLNATTINLRDAGSDSEAELKGNISAFVAATKQFTLRGVAVDASAATLKGCPAGGLANGLFVELKGSVSPTGVKASSIQCSNEPAEATVEREGIAGTVDVTAKTFQITPEKGPAINVKWTDATYFGGLTTATLSGKKVQAEGALVGGVLTATKVKLND
jgi:Domain of unknown function (DUF5666)